MPPATGPRPACESAQELRSGSLQTDAFLKALQGSSTLPRPPGRQMAKAMVRPETMTSGDDLEVHES